MPDAAEMLSIFSAALDRAAGADRAGYLQAACGEDAALRSRLEALLRAHDEAGSFLAKTPATDSQKTTRPTPVERTGAVIGPYKLLEQIGEGGMGLVFVAEQREPVRRNVALKLIKPGMDTREVIARFEAERQALALMDHPNIAKVLDAGTVGVPASAGESGDEDCLKSGPQPGRPYFVMELVCGLPITEYCDLERLTPRERLALFVDVCHAVQHAHQKGIIHRDIKPTNVLISSHDGAPVVKVIDFGVAKAIGSRLTDKTVYTALAQIVGTPLYMSPEQAGMGSLDVDTRSDIYSLGVLLYELLTGTTPFDNERLRKAEFDEMRRIIREEDPPKPSKRLSDLSRGGTVYKEPLSRDTTGGLKPPCPSTLVSIAAQRQTGSRRLCRLFRGELDWIVMKALEKDRNRRYESAAAFAADVQQYLADEPVQACPPSAAYRMSKFVRRNRGPVMAAGLFLLMLVCGMAGASRSLLRATVAEKNALAEAKSKEEERDKALRAERQGRHELFNAKLAEARASRRSRQPGQRLDTWKALTKAAELARELQLEKETLLDLRSEAVACLALTDLKRLKRWEGFPSEQGQASLDFDANLEHYAYVDTKGNISVRRVTNDQQLAWLPAPCPFSPGASARVQGFSPNGNLLAVCYPEVIAGQSTNFLLWDWRKEKVVLQPRFSVYWHAVSFSPDGRHLALGREDGTVTLFPQDGTWHETTITVARSPRWLAFSPNSRRVAVSAQSQIQVHDIEGGNLICQAAHPGGVHGVAWHPDGVLLAAGCDDSNIYLLDAETGRQHAVLRGHHSESLGLAFAPSGDTLLSAAFDGSRLWDTWSGCELLHFPGRAYQFSRDGCRLANHNGTNLEVWELSEVREHRTLPRRQGLGNDAMRDGSFSPNGRYLTLGTTRGIRLWDLAQGNEVAFVPLPAETFAVKFHPGGNQVFTSGDNGVHEWPLLAAEGVLRLGPAHKLPVGAVQRISLDREGRNLAAVGHHVGWLLDLANVDDSGNRVQHPYAVFVATSPDGRWTATGSWGGHGVKLWDTTTGNPLITLIPDARIAWAGFSPDGRLLVTGTPVESAVWETPQGDEPPDVAASWKLRRRIHSDATRGLVAAFGADSKLLAITLTNSVVQLLDPTTGHTFARLTAPDSYPWEVRGFSPDGAQLITTTNSGAGAVRVWDLRRIREKLKEIDLDWDLPAYPPTPPLSAVTPLRVEVDLPDAIAGRKHILESRWDKAAVEYAKIIGMTPEDHTSHFLFAASLLLSGDTDGYRRACARALKRFGGEEDLYASYFTARACGLAPDALSDQAVPIRLMERYAAAESHGFSYHALGLAHYRAQQYEQAIAQLEESKKVDPSWDEFTCVNGFVLALAHHRLGHAEEARAELEKTVRRLEQGSQNKGESATFPENIVEWLSCLILRREAEATIGMPSKITDLK